MLSSIYGQTGFWGLPLYQTKGRIGLASALPYPPQVILISSNLKGFVFACSVFAQFHGCKSNKRDSLRWAIVSYSSFAGYAPAGPSPLPGDAMDVGSLNASWFCPVEPSFCHMFSISVDHFHNLLWGKKRGTRHVRSEVDSSEFNSDWLVRLVGNANITFQYCIQEIP